MIYSLLRLVETLYYGCFIYAASQFRCKLTSLSMSNRFALMDSAINTVDCFNIIIGIFDQDRFQFFRLNHINANLNENECNKLMIFTGINWLFQRTHHTKLFIKTCQKTFCIWAFWQLLSSNLWNIIIATIFCSFTFVQDFHYVCIGSGLIKQFRYIFEFCWKIVNLVLSILTTLMMIKMPNKIVIK